MFRQCKKHPFSVHMKIKRQMLIQKIKVRNKGILKQRVQE
jgi:hypothetical protein